LQLCIIVNLKNTKLEILKDIEKENKIEDPRCRWFIYSSHNKFKTNIIKLYYKLRRMKFIASNMYYVNNNEISINNEDVEYNKLKSFIAKIMDVYINSDINYSEILYCGNRWDGHLLSKDFLKLQYCDPEELMLIKFSKMYSMFN